MPPVKYCSISKEALSRKYTEENWPERLEEYTHETVEYSRKTMRIWKSGATVMAVITWHSNPTGTEMVIRLLREQLPDGDVIWDIDHSQKAKSPSTPTSTATKEIS